MAIPNPNPSPNHYPLPNPNHYPLPNPNHYPLPSALGSELSAEMAAQLIEELELHSNRQVFPISSFHVAMAASHILFSCRCGQLLLQLRELVGKVPAQEPTPVFSDPLAAGSGSVVAHSVTEVSREDRGRGRPLITDRSLEAKPFSEAQLSLIPRLHPASFPGFTQPHSQAPPSLIPRLHPVSFPGSTQSHSQAPPSLIPRLHPASFPGSTQPHSQAPPSLVPSLIPRLDCPGPSWLSPTKPPRGCSELAINLRVRVHSAHI